MQRLSLDLMCAEKNDVRMVYAITPETPFTPTTSINVKGVVYKVGTQIKKTESRHVEYKTGGGHYPVDILPSHIRKYGSAFLNSSGGVLCVGVTDEGIVNGIRLETFSKRQRIRNKIKEEFDKFTPSVKENLYEINFIPCNKQDYYVLEVSIRAGDPFEIYSDGLNKMYYKRDGSVEGPLWPCKIREIVMTKYRQKMKLQSKERHNMEEDRIKT